MRKRNILSVLTTLLLASCICFVSCVSSGISSPAVHRWTQKFEIMADDLAMISESEATKQWAKTIGDLLDQVNEAFETGQGPTVETLVETLRAQKPLIIEELRKEGKKSEEIFLIVSGLETVLGLIEESIRPE